MNNSLSKINLVLISISLIGLGGLIINIGEGISLILLKNNFEQYSSMILAIYAPFGLAIVPYVIAKKLNLIHTMLKFRYVQAIVYFIIILFFNLLLIHSSDMFHDLIIAISEELLFRFIILNVLMNKFSKKGTFLIGSILFAIILHLNGNLLINIFTKFPAGLILYYLNDKSGIQSSIAFHWFYNISISYLLG